MPPKTVAARIEARIRVIRGERVMLDSDLAALYGVPTKSLNLAVRRNRRRFPPDFMFRLTAIEAANLRFQSETSSSAGHGGRRYLPYAFTEQGVAMLSSVLNGDRAIAANILIMRTFVHLRHALNETAQLGRRMDAIERIVDVQGTALEDVLQALRSLEEPAAKPRPEIGFRPKT